MTTATTLRLLASGCSARDLNGRYRQAELAIRDELTAGPNVTADALSRLGITAAANHFGRIWQAHT